jgi:hypothetical protein
MRICMVPKKHKLINGRGVAQLRKFHERCKQDNEFCKGFVWNGEQVYPSTGVKYSKRAMIFSHDLGVTHAT